MGVSLVSPEDQSGGAAGASDTKEATQLLVKTAVELVATSISQHDEVAVDGHGGVVMLAKRRDSDLAAMVSDGDFGYISLDENQRVKVATQPASVDSASGNITASGQNVSIKCGRFGNIAVSMVATALTGHNVSFECSNNSTTGTDGNWYSVQAVRSNANTVEIASGVLTATPVYMWHVNVGDYQYFRVRATAHTGGTAAYILKPGAYATEPIPAIQLTGTQPISGTVTANIGTSGLTIYTDSTVNLGISAAFTGTSRDAGATAAYNIFIANGVADQAGTMRLEKSTDGTTWRRSTAEVVVAVNTGVSLEVRVTTRYNRVVFTNGAVAQTQFLLTSAYQRI